MSDGKADVSRNGCDRRIRKLIHQLVKECTTAPRQPGHDDQQAAMVAIRECVVQGLEREGVNDGIIQTVVNRLEDFVEIDIPSYIGSSDPTFCFHPTIINLKKHLPPSTYT